MNIAANQGLARDPPILNMQKFQYAKILVVTIYAKNISKIGSFPQVGVKIKKIFKTTTQLYARKGDNPQAIARIKICKSWRLPFEQSDLL